MEILELIFELFFKSWIRRVQTKGEWFGIVKEKQIKESFFRRKKSCLIVFRTEEGSQKEFWMNKDDFSHYQLGKWYHKKLGDYIPDPQSGT